LNDVTINLNIIFKNAQVVVSAPTAQVRSTGLFEMIVGVLTTCHTQYT